MSIGRFTQALVCTGYGIDQAKELPAIFNYQNNTYSKQWHNSAHTARHGSPSAGMTFWGLLSD